MSLTIKRKFQFCYVGMLALMVVFCSNSSRAQRLPPGFEFLSEPQLNEIDVYYGGYYLVSTLAEFTLDTVTFIDPVEIARLVPDLIDAEALTGFLSRPLETNEQELCFSRYETECGILTPADVGIIFDRNTLQATLFISADLLAVRDFSDERYLPDSSAGFSLITENTLNFSGYGNDPVNYNLLNSTHIAVGESRLLLRNNFSDYRGASVDTIAWQREYRGKNYQVGVFQGFTNSFSFMDTEQLIGATMESSVLTRTDLRRSQGTEIGIFLTSRSRVEVYRDSLLLATEYYDVGNQILETSSLPAGSYEIELRITDASGVSRTETHFFSKSNRLPPKDQSLYFIQAGQVIERTGMNFLGEQGEMVLRGGYSTRLSDSIGLDLGVS
jgi:hypothetical protein